MASETSKTPEVSLRNTKQELLSAYKTLLKQVEAKEKKELKPEKKSQEKEKEKILAEVNAITTEAVEKNIRHLKGEIGDILTQLSDRLGGEVSKLEKIQKGIWIKEAELKEIYEIDKSAATLAALIEAHHQEREMFEEEMTGKKEKLLREIEQTRETWEAQQERYQTDIKERHEIERKKREREKEEYEYAFQRERQLAKDTFNDEQARLSAEKESIEKEIATIRKQSEEILSEREQSIQAREEEIRLLKAQVDRFSQELENAVSEAVTESTEKINFEADYKEKLILKQFEGEKNVLKTRIESLEKTVKEQSDQISKLSQLQEMAYQKVQDVAVKAIEGASNTASYSALQKRLAEQAAKPGMEK